MNEKGRRIFYSKFDFHARLHVRITSFNTIYFVIQASQNFEISHSVP